MSDVRIHSDGLTETGRVPAEHRFFGLDRRTLLPGLVVIVLYLLWAVVVPAVNEALSYDQTTEGGDIFLLGPGITLEAQDGWGVEKGLLKSEKTRSKIAGEDLLLVNGGVSFEISAGLYEGGLRPLLGAIDKLTAAQQGHEAFTVNGDVQPFTTSEGHPGLGQTYTTVEGEGAVAALQYGETGLKIIAVGPDSEPESKLEEIAKMIAGIRYDPGSEG